MYIWIVEEKHELIDKWVPHFAIFSKVIWYASRDSARKAAKELGEETQVFQYHAAKYVRED